MALIVSETIQKWTDALPRDYCINTLHFADGTPDPLSDVDYNSLADDVNNALKAFYNTLNVFPGRGFETKVYELDDAKPRPVRGHAEFTATQSMASDHVGARQIAAVLSFYSLGRNLPRQRGRIYLGPFSDSRMNTLFVHSEVLGAAPALVTALGAVGGTSMNWVTFSEVGGGHHTVTNWYMDNSWDVQRRRKLKDTSRVSGTTGG